MRTGLISLIMVLGGYWLYFYQTSIGGESIAAARTAVVNVIVMVETAYLMSCRSLSHSVFYVGIFSNPLALVGAAAMIGAQLLFTYAPFMQHLFHTAPIDAGASPGSRYCPSELSNWQSGSASAAIAAKSFQSNKTLRPPGKKITQQPTKHASATPLTLIRPG